MPVFRTVDPVASTTLKHYEHRQLLHRAHRYIYIKGTVNALIVLLFLLTFPPELRLRMAAIALADALLLVPYWFLVQRYPTLATCLSLCMTSLAISAGDWVGGYQTGASGILYGLLILGGHLVLIKPLSTYLLSALVTAIYVGTITLEVNGIIPIRFPFTMSNLSRVVTLNVISMFGLTILTGMVTRLYRELLQRNKELFALNAISTAAGQSLDMDKVLQLALDRVLEMMELEGGGLYLLEASTGEMVLKAHRNLAEEFVGRMSSTEVGVESFTDALFKTGQVLVIDDLSQHPVMSEIVGDRNGHHPLAAVPLKVEDRVVGVMNLLGQTGRSFTSQDVRLLSTIGAQIGLAIEHARLYYTEQDRRQMAESLRETMGVIGSTLELDEVLHLILEQLWKVIDYDTSSIMMLEGDRLQVIAFAGLTDPEEVPKRAYTVKEAGLSREAIRKEQALVVADVTKYPRWMYEPQTADVRAWIGAPLIAEGEVIGILTVDSYQVGKYSQGDAQLVMTFARQAALAVKNAQLFRETKQRFEKTLALYQTSLDISERKRAEELLRIKSHTIESAITGIAIAESGGNLTYVNPTFVKMWGYDDESEVLEKPALDFWQSKEKAQEVVEALRGEGNFVGELVAKRKDGSLFDVQLSGSMVTDEIGKPICMMASFVDITDRKRSEEALRASEERFRSIAERAFDMIFLLNVEEGRIIYASPAVERVTHYRSEELVGEPFQNYLPESDIPKAAQALTKILKGEDIEGLEVEVLRKDGSLASIEFNASAIFRDEEVIVLGIARDITWRKQAEEALRESEERCRSLIESARDVIYTVSMEGTITSLNPAFETITDWSRTEWLGKPLTSIVHPDDWPLAVEMFERMLRGEAPPLHEVRFRSKSGEYLVGEFMITPHIQHGKMVGILGVGRDITERKRVEAELSRYRDRLEELVEERTAELSEANILLEQEIVVRKQVEEALERRATQLAVVNQVARRAASILDLDQLLQEVVVAIQQGFNYHNVALALLAEAAGQLELRAVAGGFADLVPPDYRQAVGTGMVGWVAETGQSLLANDVSQEPRYILGYLKEPLPKAELCVPLRLADKVIGVLDVQDIQLNAFDETDLLAMETLADQVAVAIENARLFGETSRRFEEMTALYHTSLDITTRLEMPNLLKSIVERAVTLLQAEGGGIYLYDPEREELKLDIGWGHAEKLVGTALKPGEGMAGKVFQTGEPFIVDDYRTWEGRATVYEADQPFTAVLEAPLKWQDRTIGVLVIDADAQKRTFDQNDIWLATLFANQAAVAIENAQIYEEERKKTGQLELIGGITQKVVSILDLDELLPQVARMIGDTFGYYHTSILLVEADSDELVLRASVGPLGEALVDHLRLKIGQEGITGWVARSGEPLLVNDTRREARHYPVEDSEYTRSELAVPIKLKEETIGVLDVQAVEFNAFNQDDVSILQTLADQLAIAIENARLYQQTDGRLQTRVRELAALYAITEVVAHSLDLDTTLQLVLDKVMSLTGMDSGGILLLDPSINELFLRTHRGGSPEFIRAVSRTGAEEGLMPRMLNSVLAIDDLSEVTRDRRMAMEKEGIQSLVSIPLKAHESPLGVMVIASHSPRTLAAQELELLAAIGNQVGVAVDRAHLQTQELRAAVLEERQHMARQMHDDIAQTLGYLGLQVDSVMDSPSLAQDVGVQAELEQIRKAIEDTYGHVRSSIRRLEEDVPSHFDLRATLPEIISQFETQTGCRVELEVDESQLSRLPPSVAFQAAYIIREALTNVRKHAGADSVHLTLQGPEDGRVEVSVQDNGRGFDLDSNQQSGRRGFGLRFMRERAERVGGSLRIESEPGHGTWVVINLPSG
jgi:PAS domain S-box-containing protein